MNSHASKPGQPSDEDSPLRELDRTDMIRLAAGHDRALNDLMERHGSKLFHYLIRCLQNEDDAADIAQETFVRVYQHRARFDPAQKFTTWLYTIATNLVRSEHRRRARHPATSLEAESESTGTSLRETLPAKEPPPSETVEANERVALVRQAVAELDENLRLPLLLAEYEERSHAEIGAILDCSPKAVEMRIYRARQQLRERLEKLPPPDRP